MEVDVSVCLLCVLSGKEAIILVWYVPVDAAKGISLDMWISVYSGLAFIKMGKGFIFAF